MSSFMKGLGLDLYDFQRKFVSITEHNYADASFCLGAFMWQALNKPEGGVCLLSLHHALQHHYHLGMRLGYNLTTLQGKRFEGLDSLELFNSTNGFSDEPDEMIKNIFFLFKSKLDNVRKNSKNAFVVIDCLSDLLNIGVSLKDIISFVQYLRISLESEETIVICSHCNESDNDQMLVSLFIALTSHIRLDIRNLETGFSKEVTGSITLTKRDIDNISGWSDSSIYHYKTGERSIKVFPPGNITFAK